jgi:glucose/arabinose dehydrogenase
MRTLSTFTEQNGISDRHGALLATDDVGNVVWRVTSPP